MKNYKIIFLLITVCLFSFCNDRELSEPNEYFGDYEIETGRIIKTSIVGQVLNENNEGGKWC